MVTFAHITNQEILQLSPSVVVRQDHQIIKLVQPDNLIIIKCLYITDYAAQKSKSILWFVSNCFSSKRMNYKNELQKYIQVSTILITGKGLGGAMVQPACSNGYAICKDLSSSPTYGQWSFSPVTRFSQSKINS